MPKVPRCDQCHRPLLDFVIKGARTLCLMCYDREEERQPNQDLRLNELFQRPTS